MVVLNSGTSITNSSTIGSQHFGLNFLLHQDGGSEEFIVFEDVVNDLHNTGSIRFPRGTVAEVGVQRIDDNGNTFFATPPLDISLSDGNLANSTQSFLANAALSVVGFLRPRAASTKREFGSSSLLHYATRCL